MYLSGTEPRQNGQIMHPALFVFAALGIAFWVYSIHLVNEEVEKLQQLAKNDRESIYSVELKAPDWRFLRPMSLRRPWVILALILAPILVVAWGITLILGLIFILFPMLIWEIIEDAWYTIKQSSSHS